MSRSSTDNDPLIGRVLDGKYTLLSVIGRGGMGVVYKAHQKSLERSVALKLMMGVEPEREAEFQRRFFLEAATAAKLKHPNTITVFDYGSTNIDGERVYYITMELLDGMTLSKLLSKGVPLPPLRAVNIAMQMCRSLREAHTAGIVHRDLKPGNIMLVKHGDDEHDGDDFVKVLDFGLAKTKQTGGSQLTKAGTFLGSPRYVAPEQIEGKPLDGRADIYSFGCVLFRMLSGRVPFDGTQAVEVMLKHLHDPIPALATAGVPASLEALVTACLQKKQTDRPRSMDDIAAALKRVRQELTGQAMSSPSLTMPDDLRALLREEPGESPPITLMPKEGSSPSHVAPASVPAYAVEAQPSPSSSYTPSSLAVLANSGEWRIGAAPPPLDNSVRPIHGHGPGSRRHVRRASWAVAAGVLIGLGVAGVGVAFRLGHLDQFIAMISPPQQPVPVTSTVKATAPASARLRIKTMPAGADVFDVTSGVPRLLGITPLVVPWQIAVGDGSRALLLKLPGHVPARAMVDPPPPSSTNEPVWLDVEASLRAATARP
jgi:serine/threonine protein kinase